MWNRPWSLKEGFIIGAGLLVTGLMLQLSVGPVDWQAFAFPVNVITLAVFLALIAVVYALRPRVYGFRYLTTFTAAVPALIYAVILTATMGLTKQLPSGPFMLAEPSLADTIGITRMLSFWPFILIYVWMTLLLGQVIIHRLLHLHPKRAFWTRDIPFLMNHLGLFITIVTATLGNADMQRLKMTISQDAPEWRAVDDRGEMHELPIAIQLKQFTIDEYPPKLILIDNNTGNAVDGQQAETLLIDSTFTEGQLGDWRIRLVKKLDYAVPVLQEDSTYFEEWTQTGAVSAVCVEADWHPSTPEKRPYLKKSGWITSGSYMFPYQMLKIDQQVSLAMMPREPQRYISRVEILTESGKDIETNILVNKPFSIDGWKIYQLNYDTQKGRWSEISILELVSDPWLPFVYTGIYMMLLGAVLMFILAQRRKEEQP
ncbi:MAG: cytochrome c biogenesis protein ResB [Prevotella sp.]|nr:cytochrome c biogenesis protein ResB [Prevotella sp.]